MIFSIQRYLEDYFQRQGLGDSDQYAVQLANLYDRYRDAGSVDDFLHRMRRVRTVFYRSNRNLDRAAFDRRLVGALDRRFGGKKKARDCPVFAFPGGIAPEASRIRRERRTIRAILNNFKTAVEGRAVDAFWRSRRVGSLRNRPEVIAQSLLAVFAKGVVADQGIVFRELASGVGFVDVAILLGKTLHLIEIKILKGNLTGDVQLATYMTTEGRTRGWLLLVDARKPESRPELPRTLSVTRGTISVLAVDIRPVAPSRKKPA